MSVSGYCKQVFRELPLEFAMEAQRPLGMSLESSVGSLEVYGRCPS